MIGAAILPTDDSALHRPGPDPRDVPPRQPGFWRFVGLIGLPIFALFLLLGLIEWVAAEPGHGWISFAAALTVGLVFGPVAAAIAYAAGRSGGIVRACVGGLFGAACGAMLGARDQVAWLPGGRYNGSLFFALTGFAVGALLLAFFKRK